MGEGTQKGIVTTAVSSRLIVARLDPDALDRPPLPVHAEDPDRFTPPGQAKAYTGRNPRNGEKVAGPVKRLPSFKCGLELKNRLNGGLGARP